MAVDVYSKWVEATPLQDKRAFTTAAWLYDAIIARWGRPLFIRCDRGGEFEGEFFEALRSMGIVRRRGTSGNKRVNGQSERGIRALRATIRKYMAEYPGAQWTDVLPYALIALRLTAQRAHGFPPFTIITGRVPILPDQPHFLRSLQRTWVTMPLPHKRQRTQMASTPSSRRSWTPPVRGCSIVTGYCVLPSAAGMRVPRQWTRSFISHPAI